MKVPFSLGVGLVADNSGLNQSVDGKDSGLSVLPDEARLQKRPFRVAEAGKKCQLLSESKSQSFMCSPHFVVQEREVDFVDQS